MPQLGGSQMFKQGSLKFKAYIEVLIVSSHKYVPNCKRNDTGCMQIDACETVAF